jgi:hypothetical protein
MTADSSPAFAFSASETGSTFVCLIDDGAAAPCSSPFTSVELTDGPHTFSVTATDGLGNVDASPATRAFTVDTLAPQTTIDSGPAAGSTIADGTPALAFSSSQTGSTFSCAIDGGTAFSCSSPFTPSVLADGPHTVSVSATDVAGNVELTPATRAFTVDTTLPQTTIDSGPASGAFIADSTPTFEFSSSKADSTFACQIDDGETFMCDSPFTPGALADGEHTFSVTATDAPGNTDGSPATRTFTVDTAAPQTTLDDGPVAGSTIADSTPTFAFSSTETGSTFSCKLDGGPAVTCDSPLTPSALADGEHTFSVTAADAAGNVDESPATVTFTVDAAAPQTTITGGPASGAVVADSTPTFAFSSTEPGSTFSCKLDGGTTFTCDSPFTPSALTDGEHTFFVTAADAVGNVDGSPATRTFTVDTGAVQTTISDGPAQGSTTADNTPTFTFSSSQTGSTFSCTIDGGTAFACASGYTPGALSDGEHTFSATATDATGNIDQTAATRTFTINTAPAAVTPPVVPPPVVPPPVVPPPVVMPPVVKPPVVIDTRCGSRRKFNIMLHPKGVRLTSAVVIVIKTRVKVRTGSDGRLRATVDLRRLEKGVYKVTIDARDARGRHYKETRRYKVC